MKNQVIQFFNLSIDDLNMMIVDAVKSVIQKPIEEKPISNTEELEFENDLLSSKDVMVILKISSTTLWRFNKNDTLRPKSKIGRKVYYSKSEVYNLINNI